MLPGPVAACIMGAPSGYISRSILKLKVILTQSQQIGSVSFQQFPRYVNLS